MFTSSPPDPNEIVKYLEFSFKLSVHSFLFLALPVKDLTGFNMWTDGASWFYREGVCPGDAPLETLAEMIFSQRKQDDLFFDLSKPPFVKILSSGNRQILFGSDILYDAPQILSSLSTPAPVLLSVFDLVGEAEVPFVQECEGVSYFVDGDSYSWTISNVESKQQDLAEVNAAAASEIKSRLSSSFSLDCTDIVLFESEFVGLNEYEYIFCSGTYQLVVPVSVSGQSEIIGVTPEDIHKIESFDYDVHHDFSLVGVCWWDSSSVVVSHKTTGIVCLYRSIL